MKTKVKLLYSLFLILLIAGSTNVGSAASNQREMMLGPNQAPPMRISANKKNNAFSVPKKVKEEIVTLEMKDIDIVEVLKVLSQKGSINIIIGQNVKGRITIFLKDVTVWEAMKNVFEIANLAYIKKGDVYQIMTGRDYLQLYGREFFDNRKMKIILVHNADANDVLASVKGIVSKIGSINLDARTNSLIVVDAEINIERIEEAIIKIDKPFVTEIFTLTYLSVGKAEEIVKGIVTKKGSYQTDVSTQKLIVSDIPGNIEKITRIIREYDIPTNLETRVYKLNYASYEKVEVKIKELLTANLGKISADERTNTIVVIDLPSNIRKIDEVIAAYDEKTREVLIEAKIVQVRLSDRFQYGINWNYVFDSAAENLSMNVLSAFEKATSTVTTVIEEGADSPEDSETETAFADTITSFSEGGARVVVTGSLNETDFDAVVNALRVVGDAKVLSSPRIMVVSGEEAKIQVATQEAYVTDTVSQGQSTTTTAENVTFIDVGVILTVTPKINREGYILMKIKPKVSAVQKTVETASGNTIPIVATQEAESTVLVKDGITIVMGGLIEEIHSEDTRKVPFLGDIPILGIPFRKKTSRTRKNELVLFLTPRIIAGDKNFYEVSGYEITDEVREIYDKQLPVWYVNPWEKTKLFLRKEFKAE